MKKLLILPLLFLIVSCNSVADFFVSDADEKEIGRQYNAMLQDSMKVLSANDPRAAWVNNKGKEIARYQDRTNFTSSDFHFYVVDEDVINAFALPGGYIYIYTGLLEKAATEEQIIGVIAHEIGHVAAEHYKEQVIKHNGLSFLAALVTGKSAAGDIAANLGVFLTQMQMSQKNEYQADSLAVEYTAEANISPWGMKHFLDTLNGLDKSYTAEIFKTHPSSDRRANEVAELIQASHSQFPESGDNTANPFR